MVLAGGEVADVRVALHRAALGVHQHREHRLDVGRVGGQRRRRAGRPVVELLHVVRQLAAQLVDARHQGLEVVAVLDAGHLGDLLDALAFEPDQVGPQDRVVGRGGRAEECTGAGGGSTQSGTAVALRPQRVPMRLIQSLGA